MKNAVFLSMCVLGLALASGSAAAGESGKAKAAAPPAAAEVTLKGDLVCAKCALHESDKCQGVLRVTDAGKETRYYLADNKVAKDNHKPVCSGAVKKATITGTVKDTEGKKVLTASNIQYE